MVQRNAFPTLVGDGFVPAARAVSLRAWMSSLAAATGLVIGSPARISGAFAA